MITLLAIYNLFFIIVNRILNLLYGYFRSYKNSHRHDHEFEYCTHVEGVGKNGTASGQGKAILDPSFMGTLCFFAARSFLVVGISSGSDHGLDLSAVFRPHSLRASPLFTECSLVPG